MDCDNQDGLKRKASLEDDESNKRGRTHTYYQLSIPPGAKMDRALAEAILQPSIGPQNAITWRDRIAEIVNRVLPGMSEKQRKKVEDRRRQRQEAARDPLENEEVVGAIRRIFGSIPWIGDDDDEYCGKCDRFLVSWRGCYECCYYHYTYNDEEYGYKHNDCGRLDHLITLEDNRCPRCGGPETTRARNVIYCRWESSDEEASSSESED